MEQVVLDLIPAGAKGVCHVSQNDIGRTIRFNLVSGGTVYTLAGTETIKVHIKKPDGTTSERNIANTSSTYVDWVTGEGDCDVSGKNECELVITSGTTVIGSKNFTMKVEEDPYNGQGVVIETASGNPAVFDTNIVDLFVEIKCTINAIQEGTPWIDSNVIEKEPYNFRKVAGTASRIGNHLFDKLVGGTVAWNQYAQKLDAYSNYSMNGIDITANSENTLTIDGTATGSLQYSITKSTITLIKDHIYFVPIPTGLTNLQYYINGVNNNFVGIFKCDYTNETNRYICIKFVGGDSFNNYKMPIIPQVFDLTAMFGSTIADYIYSLEQATAGAGVAFFRKLFPKDYYAYNAGELMSVKTTAHKMVGFNTFDEDMELGTLSVYTGEPVNDNTMLRSKNFCRCFPNTLYNLTYKGTAVANGMRVYLYDENYQFFDFWGFTNNVGREVDFDKAHYFKVGLNAEYGTTYKNDICVNISTPTGSPKNGDYLPYSAHTYALDDVELRGLFKLDSNNKLYADGDTYESSGDVTRKYVELELGNMTWSLRNNNETRQAWYTNDTDGVIKHTSNQSEAYKAIMSNGFKAISYNDSWFPLTFSPSESSLSQLVICVEPSKFVDGTAFANWLSTNNVKLVIEAASETTETADPFTNPQQVDANGTEEYIDSRSPAIPVGHETYYADIYDITGFTSCKVSVADGQGVERKSATIAFGQTVYGGYLEYKNGQWQFVGNKQYTDMGSCTWKKLTDGVFWTIPTGMLLHTSSLLSNKFTYHNTGYSNLNDYEFTTLSGDGEIYAKISGITDATSFTNAVSGTQLVYELATPFTLTLTGNQLETLLGENRVSHNCNGDTEVKYLYNA